MKRFYSGAIYVVFALYKSLCKSLLNLLNEVSHWAAQVMRISLAPAALLFSRLIVQSSLMRRLRQARQRAATRVNLIKSSRNVCGGKKNLPSFCSIMWNISLLLIKNHLYNKAECSQKCSVGDCKDIDSV